MAEPIPPAGAAVAPSSGAPAMKPLGIAWHVDQDASSALGDIEKSYISMMSTMEGFFKNLQRDMKNTSDATTEAEKASEDAGKSTDTLTGKFGELTDALRKDLFSLEEMGISWGKLITLLEGITAGAVLYKIIEFFGDCLKKALEFRSAVAQLNEVFYMNAKASREVSSSILELEGRNGQARDQVIYLTRSMLELGLVPEKLKKLGTTFKDLSKDLFDFASATGIGMDQAAAFEAEMIDVGNIPVFRIRGIAAAIKSVADSSRMTANELTSFAESLSPIYAALSDKSGDARAAFTENMLGLAGALKDAGIDAHQATSHFADMLDVTSESGTEALAKLSVFTGKSVEQLRKLVETNPAAVFDELSKSAAKMPISQLQLMGRSLQPLGLGFVDLAKLRKVGQEMGATGKHFQERAEAAAHASAKEDALAKKAAARQDAYEAQIKRFTRMWEHMMIEVGGTLADALTPVLNEKVIPLMKELILNIKKVDFKTMFRTTADVLGGLADIEMFAMKVSGRIFDFISGGVNRVFKLLNAAILLFTGDFQGAGQLVKEVVGDMLMGVYDFAMFVPRLIGKAFGVDLDKVLAKAAAKFPALWKTVKASFFEALAWMHDKLSWFGGKAGEALSGVGQALMAPFVIIGDFIMRKVDELLAWIGRDIAPKVANIPVVGEDLAKALKGLGESAQIRVTAREEEDRARAKAAANTVATQLGRTGEASPAAIAGGEVPAAPAVRVTNANRIDMPDRMRTSSPEQEALMREQVSLARDMRNLMKKSPTGAGNPKLSYALGVAGH